MLKKLKNDNTGSTQVLRAVCYLILVIVLAFTLDIIVVLAQNVVVSYEAAYYAEKISIQAGLLGNDDTLRYPSINEVSGGSGNACYDYQPICNGCLKNKDIGSNIGKTLGYFGVNDYSWQADATIGGSKVVIHSRTSGNDISPRRVVGKYMSTGTFKLSTDWRPIFSKWIAFFGNILWKTDTPYVIDKEVPLIIEYIPQVNKNDPNCVSGWYEG